MDANTHCPVLAEEVLAGLELRADGIYIDATYGRGGHSAAILSRLGPVGRLYALDQDPLAVADAQARFGSDQRFSAVRGRFSMLGDYVDGWGVKERVNGILIDLGVSSPQLDEPARGFSFRSEGPLDMRMDPDTGLSAAQWLNGVDEGTLTTTLRTLGEERYAKRVARAIVKARAVKRIETTAELAAVVRAAVPTREPGKDPATRSFQAIRMAVNHELDELQGVLPQALNALAPGGRLAVISFHSLEDRIVKNFMRDEAQGPRFPRRLPVTAALQVSRLKIVGRAVRPGAEEVRQNPRARSATLRIAERVGPANA